MVNLVDGDGVVGEQPILAPGQWHDYVSGCPLSTPSGSMEGFYTFRVQGGNGAEIEAAIPFFPPPQQPRRPQADRRPARMKRTHLPLNALRVFDAATRHLSFTRAADELAVTPAAVGQQIRALEDFARRRPVPPHQQGSGADRRGRRRAGGFRSGFLQFEDAVQAMQAGQSSRVYTIARRRAISSPHGWRRAWRASAPAIPSCASSCSTAGRPISPKPTSTSRCAGATGRATSKARLWAGRAGHGRHR